METEKQRTKFIFYLTPLRDSDDLEQANGILDELVTVDDYSFESELLDLLFAVIEELQRKGCWESL